MSNNLSVMTANREQIENLSIKKITMGEPISQSEAREIVRNFPKEIVNANDGRVVNFPVATVGKIHSSKNMNAIKIIRDIPDLFRTSLRAWSEPEKRLEGHKVHRNIKEYHHYINKFTDGTDVFYVRFTVPEQYAGNAKSGTSVIHTATVSDVSIYKKGDLSRRALVTYRGVESQPPFIDKKLQEFLASN